MFALLSLTAEGQETALPEDPGWPRVFEKDGKQLIVSQPPVEEWRDYKLLDFRCAIEVKTSAQAGAEVWVL